MCGCRLCELCHQSALVAGGGRGIEQDRGAQTHQRFGPEPPHQFRAVKFYRAGAELQHEPDRFVRPTLQKAENHVAFAFAEPLASPDKILVPRGHSVGNGGADQNAGLRLSRAEAGEGGMNIDPFGLNRWQAEP